MEETRTVASESTLYFWKSARQVSLTEEDQGSQRVNGESTRAQTCTRTLLDVSKDLEGRYWKRWREEVSWIGRAGKSTPSPHTCAHGLIRGPMALLYGTTTHWNRMRAGWSHIVSTESYGEAPHFTFPNASSLTLLKSRGLFDSPVHMCTPLLCVFLVRQMKG